MTIDIDLTHLPDWVNWIAQDADGAVWGYSVEPLEHENGWYENEVGDRIKLAEGATNPTWRDSLQKISR